MERRSTRPGLRLVGCSFSSFSLRSCITLLASSSCCPSCLCLRLTTTSFMLFFREKKMMDLTTGALPFDPIIWTLLVNLVQAVISLIRNPPPNRIEICQVCLWKLLEVDQFLQRIQQSRSIVVDATLSPRQSSTTASTEGFAIDIPASESEAAKTATAKTRRRASGLRMVLA